MKNYLVLRGDEDGNPTTWYSEEELNEFLQDEAEGLNFLPGLPEEKDPNYWKENDVLVLEVKVKKIKLVATSFRVEED